MYKAKGAKVIWGPMGGAQVTPKPLKVYRVGGGDSFTGAMIYSLITGKDDKDSFVCNIGKSTDYTS